MERFLPRMLRPANSARSDGRAREAVSVWDVPTRLFHWAVVLLVSGAWFTADQGYMRAHQIIGIAVLVLVVTRLIWGFIGSTTARFASFLRGPRQVLDYLKAVSGGELPLFAGHNPAGALMVMAFLAVLVTQATTGLFANDGVKFHGPLALEISASTSDFVTQLHMWLFNGILLLVWMHVLAIFYYWLVRDENLVRPMLTGAKHPEDVPPGTSLRFANPRVALMVLVAVAGVVVYALF